MLVQDLIKRALRELNTYAAGQSPTGAELTDALSSYNTMLRSMFGVAVGPRLLPIVAGASTSAINGGLYRTAAGITLTLPANPRDGSRFGVSNNSGASVTITANGWRIAGAASVSVATGTNATYFFRGDTGAWTLEADQALTDATIFAPDMDEHLVFMLAARLQAGYSDAPPPPTVIALAQAGEVAFVQRYGRGPRQMRNAA